MGMTLAGITASLASLGFELRRSWPRSADHLLLDLQPSRDLSGKPVAGQWFRDADEARATAAATPGATCAGRVVLQPGGGDRKLVALGMLLQDPRTELVSHRPERRAVLRHRAGPNPTYTKMVATKKHRALETITRAAERLSVRTPRVHSSDPDLGTVTTEALPGRTLHELLAEPVAEAACAAAGAALAAIHRIAPPPDLPVHGWVEERAVTRRWQQHADSYQAPAHHRTVGENGGPEADLPEDSLALVHRDFHDRQVLIADDGSVGVLDFDLMAVGDPALDLANLLAHLDLRCRQGLADDAGSLRRAALSGYAPDEQIARRVPGYEALAQQRLAAVYAFRTTLHIT